jgi:hypothetical protein
LDASSKHQVFGPPYPLSSTSSQPPQLTACTIAVSASVWASAASPPVPCSARSCPFSTKQGCLPPCVQTCKSTRSLITAAAPLALTVSCRRYAALPSPPYSCPIDVSYNNVFLINAVNLVVIGEALQDLGYGPNAAAAAASGYMLLDSWFAYAAANGVSPSACHGSTVAAVLRDYFPAPLVAARATVRLLKPFLSIQASTSTLHPRTVGSNCKQCNAALFRHRISVSLHIQLQGTTGICT